MINLISKIIIHLSDDEEASADYDNDEEHDIDEDDIQSIETAIKALGTKTELRGQFTPYKTIFLEAKITREDKSNSR